MHHTISCLVLTASLSLTTQYAEAHASDKHHPAVDEIRYEVIPMGPALEPGGFVDPVDLNNRGEMIGMVYTSNVQPFHWDCRRGRTEIPPVNSTVLASTVSKLNDAGDVIGTAYELPDANGFFPFIWSRSEGARALIETRPGAQTVAIDLNDSGMVLGVELGSAESTYFLWSERGGRVDVPNQDFFYQALTNRGELVGLGMENPESIFFVRPRGDARLFVSLPAGYRQFGIYDVNGRNDVIGAVLNVSPSYLAGYLVRNNGEFEFLTPLPSSPGLVAKSINDRRQVVGSSGSPLELGRAFIWDVANGTRDLTELVRESNDNFPNVHFDLANAINDRGWIAARGLNSTTHTSHAYLLVPVAADSRVSDLHLLEGPALCKALHRAAHQR